MHSPGRCAAAIAIADFVAEAAVASIGAGPGSAVVLYPSMGQLGDLVEHYHRTIPVRDEPEPRLVVDPASQFAASGVVVLHDDDDDSWYLVALRTGPWPGAEAPGLVTSEASAAAPWTVTAEIVGALRGEAQARVVAEMLGPPALS